MEDHCLRLWLKDIFKSISPDARNEFEEKTGINPDKAPSWLLRGGIEDLIKTEAQVRECEKEDKLRKEEHQREDSIRREQYHFQARIEQAKAEALRLSLNEVAGIITKGNEEDTQRLEKILASLMRA